MVLAKWELFGNPFTWPGKPGLAHIVGMWAIQSLQIEVLGNNSPRDACSILLTQCLASSRWLHIKGHMPRGACTVERIRASKPNCLKSPCLLLAYQIRTLTCFQAEELQYPQMGCDPRKHKRSWGKGQRWALHTVCYLGAALRTARYGCWGP